MIVVGVLVMLVAAGVVAGAIVAEVSWRRGNPQLAPPRPPEPWPRSLRATVGPLLKHRMGVAGWVLLVMLALGAAYPLVVQVRAAGALAAVILSGWSLAPFAAMAVLVLAAARTSRAALVVVAPGVAALGYLGVWILEGFQIEASSTASLIFLWLPVYQLGVVAVTAMAAAGAYLLVWSVRRARRRGGRAVLVGLAPEDGAR